MITMGTPLASSATRCATEGMDLSGGGAGKKDASGLSAAPFERPAAARAGLAEPGGGPGGSNDPTAFDLEAPEPMLCRPGFACGLATVRAVLARAQKAVEGGEIGGNQ